MQLVNRQRMMIAGLLADTDLADASRMAKSFLRQQIATNDRRVALAN